MKVTNLEAVKSALSQALHQQLVTKVVPAVKGAVLEMAGRVIEGGDGYVGTPEWKGNAVANWHVTYDMPATNFEVHFTEPEGPDPDDKDKVVPVSQYSARSPRAAAVQISLGRVAAQLRAGNALPTTIYLRNTAPYLGIYQPFKVGGPLPRPENMYPMSTVRAAARTREKMASASPAQWAAWRQKVSR